MPGNVMTQSRRGNRIVQNFGTVYGSVTGMTVVNGRVISGGMDTMQTVSPIEATVCVPPRSSLAVVSQAADAAVYGDVERIEFRSISGDLYADGARDLRANTTSGDIRAGRVTEQITAQSVSGDIQVARTTAVARAWTPPPGTSRCRPPTAPPDTSAPTASPATCASPAPVT